MKPQSKIIAIALSTAVFSIALIGCRGSEPAPAPGAGQGADGGAAAPRNGSTPPPANAAASEAPADGSRPTAADGGTVLAALPAAPDPSRRYLVYLHGQIIEERGRRPRHPRLGVYEYDAILAALASSTGWDVYSEQRPSGTSTKAYAATVVRQLHDLLEAGVPAEHLAVVGFSKGGGIALYASTELGVDAVRWVIMAGCGPQLLNRLDDSPTGRLLSLYDSSDHLVDSCARAYSGDPPADAFTEIVLDVGAGHGTFYTPRPEWLGPVADFLRGPVEP